MVRLGVSNIWINSEYLSKSESREILYKLANPNLVYAIIEKNLTF